MQNTNNHKTNDEWISLQTKVFSRWVSRELSGLPNSNIQDVTKDLSNGVSLMELAEVLTHKRAPHIWDHNPTMKAENVQNCELAIDMFAKDGVKLEGISGKDISDNNQKLILNLIWSLILHYSVEKSMPRNEKNNDQSSLLTNFNSKVQDELMSWALNCTKKYSYIDHFEPFDLFMCALLDSFYPHKIKYNTLNANDHQHNAKLAFDVMNELDIACLVYPEDLKQNNYKVDEKTLLAQLAAAKYVLDKNEMQQKGFEIAFSTPEELKIKKEEEKILAEREKEIKEREEERQKEIEEERLKAQEAEKIKAINETRQRIQEVLYAKEREERVKNEEIRVLVEKQSEAKIQEARMKAEEEARQKLELEYRERMNDAENRAIKAEEEKRVLEKKLKDAESKDKSENIQKEKDEVDSNQENNDDDHHKEKHIRIKVRVHHKDENEEHKKYKIGIKIKDHHNNDNEHHHHMVCKNIKVIRNGKVVPSKIEEEPVQKDGEKQSFHVKLL